MPANYYILVKSPAGVKRGVINNFLSLAVSKGCNEPGVLKFLLEADNKKIALLEDKSQLVVRRRYPDYGIPWYDEFVCFYRHPNYKWPNREAEVFTAECPGMLDTLSWRVNAYKSGVANKSLFTNKPLETIVKTLVTANFTSSATTGAGRARNGQLTAPWTISVSADSARGYAMDRENQGATVLDEIQDCIKAAYINGNGGDIALTQTGPAAFRLDYFPGQLGADRSASVVFSVGRGNMGEPEYDEDHTEERTVAVIAGQGDGPAQAFRVRTSSEYAAGNDIEVWVNGSNETTNSALDARGDQELRSHRTQRSFRFKPLQVKSTVYGKHYFLGDRVKAIYRSVTAIQKVQTVTLTYERGSDEDIRVGLIDV